MRNRIIRSQGLLALLIAVGALLPLRTKAQPSVGGQWSEVFVWPTTATHMALLPTGKVLFIGEFEEGELPPLLWDPATGQLSELPHPGYNAFCAGHSFLADGKLLVAGGHIDNHIGEEETSVFDPFTLTWKQVDSMNAGRWYPTTTTLGHGDAVVFSGEVQASGDMNPLMQRYDAATETWKDLSNAPITLPYYPRMFLTPYGKLFCAGPLRAARIIDPNLPGAWYLGARASFTASRTYGPAVYLDGQVFLIGGGDPPTHSVERADLRDPMPSWRTMAPMSTPRRQHNATLLPDGTVLVTGGSSGAGFDNKTTPVRHAEVYDPTTNTWTSLASQAIYRGYHSTAVLLPDGRVLSGGGRRERTAEVFSPPYLFKGPRPTVTFAPETVRPGTSFFVGTPDAESITKVTLIALNAVTHAFDENQRLLTLNFSRTADGLNIEAPVNNNYAPVGYYQLFLVNDAGVPSMGRMVRVVAEPFQKSPLIIFADEWKYDDSNVDRGTAWIALDYDDSDWSSGRGQFGYGEGDEATVLDRPHASQPTVYFRKKFTLDRPITQADLEVLFDDGIAVWLNGSLIFSKYVNHGLEFDKYASDNRDNDIVRTSLDVTPDMFRLGENILAVAVKQVDATSTDLSFALGLEVEYGPEPVPDSLLVLAPNGGEEFQAGATTPIQWSSTGSISTVDLDYSTDSGATWTRIATEVPNTGSYTWTLPDIAATEALVRVSRSGSGDPSDVSDAPFTLLREATQSKLIEFGAVWKYHDDGTDPGRAWNTMSYDDSGWLSGPGELGYGDGDEATVLQKTDPVQMSVYFRKKLTLTRDITSAQLRVRFDDGVAVWVNGTRVFVRNMDKGTAHTRSATASAENEEATDSISIGPFVSGENIIGVMVKQVGRSSPDLSFDLELEVTH